MNPESFRLPLAYYRSQTRYPQLSDADWPLPEQLGEVIEALGGGQQDPRFDTAARALDVTPEELREASRFFVRQVLFAPKGDFYRVLGVDPSAGAEQIKQHHRLLMRIFQPDRRHAHEWERHFANRIHEAWTTLRDPKMRRSYDRKLGPRRIRPHTANAQAEAARTRARDFGQPRDSHDHSPKPGEILYRSRLWIRKPSAIIWSAILLIAVSAAGLAIFTSRQGVLSWQAGDQQPVSANLAGVGSTPPTATGAIDLAQRQDDLDETGPDAVATEPTPKLLKSSPAGSVKAGLETDDSQPAELATIRHDEEQETVVPDQTREATPDRIDIGIDRMIARVESPVVPAETPPYRTNVESPATPAEVRPPEVASDSPAREATPPSPAQPSKASAAAVTQSSAQPSATAMLKPSPAPAEADGDTEQTISRSPATQAGRPEQTAGGAAALSTTSTLADDYGDISKLELNMLLARFLAAYENGDLKRFTRVFSRDVSLNDGEGYRALLKAYKSLFRNTEARRMVLNDISWIPLDDTHLKGWARTDIELWPTGQEGSELFTGNIVLVVEKKSDKLQITRFDHHMTSQP
ncbi:MAG: DnaJ domain-containing protein [Gammaproteobacteria bacterium]|nr:DnaJ domain-containing protein [Gammaproteobacteria bacterium]